MKGIRGFVTRVTRVSTTLSKISFRLSQGLVYKPGQSVLLEVCGKKPGAHQKKVYNLCGAPEEAYRTNNYEVLAESHPHTGAIDGLGTVRAGDLLRVEGPLGSLSLERMGPEQPAVWLATPSGLAPFLSFIRSKGFNRMRPNRIVLLVDVIQESDLVYREEFEAKGISVIPCITRPRDWVDGFWGKANALLKGGRFRVSFSEATFFISSEDALATELVKTLITEKGVAPDRIVREHLMVRLNKNAEGEAVWVPVELVEEDQKDKKILYPSLLKAA